MVGQPDSFIAFLQAAAVIFATGGAGWALTSISNLRRDLNDFKVHIAENYMHKDTLTSLENEVKAHGRILYGIAGKLGVDTSQANDR